MSSRAGHARAPRPGPGFTLVELMVALALGSFVTLSVLTLYLSVSRNYVQDERYALLQENGRYALRVLGEDLAMADFWGQMISTDTIASPIVAPAGACATGIKAYAADSALLFNNRHVSPAHTQFTPCTAVTDDAVAGTDVLVIKRVEGSTTPVADLTDGPVYLRTNGTAGRFLDKASEASTPQLAGDADWRYVPRLYFVRSFLDVPGDGIPTLCRLGLAGASLSDLQCLAEGVEDFHLQFGIDTDVDGVANRYTATPATGEMRDVVAVRIFLLMRSNGADPHYTNSKTYRLGDVVRAAANDGFYRRVYTSTVVVRNTVGRRQFL